MSESSRVPATHHWRWRTFPVLAAFVAGLLTASIVNRETDSTLEAIVQVAAILGASYVIIHLIVSNVIAAGRIKRRVSVNPALAEDEFEDTLVHPDDP